MTATGGGTTMEDTERIGHRRIILLLLLGVNAGIVGINHTLPTFQGYTPNFLCHVDNVSAAIEGCVAELNSSAAATDKSCPQGYRFESDRGDWTPVTEWQLVCEDRFLSPLIATLYFCGVTAGAIVCGLLADRYGRRPLIFVCLYGQGLLGVSLYFAATLEAFMGLRFAQGFFVQGLQGTTYTLLMELFPPRFRTAVGVVLELYWAMGLIYLAGASFYFPHWRTLQLILSIPTALTLFYVCIVPESARWLATRGRTQEAEKVWNKLLPGNKEKLSDLVSMNKRTSEVNGTTATQAAADRNSLETRSDATGCTSSGAESHKDVIDDGLYSLQGHNSQSNHVKKSKLLNENLQHHHRCDHFSEKDGCHCRRTRQKAGDKTGRHEPDKLDEEISVTVGNQGNCEAENQLEKRENTFTENCVGSGDCAQSDRQPESPAITKRSDSEGVNYVWKQSLQDVSNAENNISISRQNSCDELIHCDSDGNNSSHDKKVNPSTKPVPRSDARTLLDVTEQKDSLAGSEDHIVLYSKPAVKCSIVERRSITSSTHGDAVQTRRSRTGVLELFRSGVLRKYNLIMVFVWFSVSLSYYGITFHLPSLSGERHLNFLIGAILEVISYVLAYVILSRYGRRLPMASYLLLSGVICIVIGGVSVVPQDDVEWIGYAQTTLALLGKAAVVSGFCTMFIFTSELFPTVLRAAATGHCGLWGRVGSLLAPQLVFLGEYTLTTVPLAIMGVLGILAGLFVFALPETLGQQLPDTVEEAEMLAKSKQQTEV